MDKQELLLIGAGGHAQVCADIIKQESNYRIAGLVATGGEVGQLQFGYKVIGADKDLSDFRALYQNAFIGIGQILTPDPRIRAYELLLKLRFKLPILISPNAYVAPGVSIGAGTIIMHGAIVNPGVSIGANCIINTRAVIEHDSVVSDHCHVSTGAILNGEVRVGLGCFIGSGSLLKEGVYVGNSCVIGMGSIVKKDISEGVKMRTVLC